MRDRDSDKSNNSSSHAYWNVVNNFVHVLARLLHCLQHAVAKLVSLRNHSLFALRTDIWTHHGEQTTWWCQHPEDKLRQRRQLLYFIKLLVIFYFV